MNVLRVPAGKHLIDLGDFLHLVDDVLVVRCRNLRSIGPVGFVAVVFFGRDDHARLTFQLPDREAQLGCRTQRVEQKYGESVRGEDVGHTLGEHPRIVAAVVPYDDPDFLAREIALQVVRKTLRRSTYRIDIHTIGAHSHDPAKTARTELEVLVKTLYKFFHIIIHQVFNLFFSLCIIIAVEPFLGFRQHLLF